MTPPPSHRKGDSMLLSLQVSAMMLDAIRAAFSEQLRARHSLRPKPLLELPHNAFMLPALDPRGRMVRYPVILAQQALECS